MRYNGTLQYSYSSPDEGGLNEYGEPVQAERAWSEPIRCSIRTLSDNRLGRYEDGQFRQASYAVLLEEQPFVPETRVRLTRQGEDLGEFGIMTCEHLLTVGRVSITV